MTHLLGVEINISCERLSQPLVSKIFWCALAKDPGNTNNALKPSQDTFQIDEFTKLPGGSSFQKGLAQAAMYASWNSLWW